MTNNLEDLLTELCVFCDDHVVSGRRPRLTDAELVSLVGAQALLGYHSERRWFRFALVTLRGMFRYLPKQPGYHKRG